MASKWYRVQGRFMRLRFHSKFGPVDILSRATEVSDPDLQKKIEGSPNFGPSIVLCDPPGAVVEEEEEFVPTDDGRLSYGLDELKAMHVTKLRSVAKRANLWVKGMTKAEMIEALIGG